MTKKKSTTIEMCENAFFEIRADGPFMVYAMNEKGEREMMLGPFNTNQWSLKGKLTEGYKTIQIVKKTDVETMYDVKWYPSKEKEQPDPRPVEIPLDCKKPESIEDMIRKYVATQLSTHMHNQGHETFDEANDFDVDEDDDVMYNSPYEEIELIEEHLDDTKHGETAQEVNSIIAEPSTKTDEKPPQTPEDSPEDYGDQPANTENYKQYVKETYQR
jgi:hypothetical protein